MLALLVVVLAWGPGCGGSGGGNAQLNVVRSFDLGARVPHGFSGLVHDGTSLWFETDVGGQVVPVDPDTGVAGVPVTLGPSPHVHAAEAAAFWTHCGCGGSREAQLRTQTDVLLDEISTETDLGFPSGLSVRGIAVDPVAGIVWLHGRDRQTDIRMFVGVDASGEPDVIASSGVFDRQIRSMAWDGVHMWALVEPDDGPLVVEQIDLSDFTVVQRFDVPRNDVAWQGIAVDSGRMFLVGSIGGTAGVLSEVAP